MSQDFESLSSFTITQPAFNLTSSVNSLVVNVDSHNSRSDKSGIGVIDGHSVTVLNLRQSFPPTPSLCVVPEF